MTGTERTGCVWAVLDEVCCCLCMSCLIHPNKIDLDKKPLRCFTDDGTSNDGGGRKNLAAKPEVSHFGAGRHTAARTATGVCVCVCPVIKSNMWHKVALSNNNPEDLLGFNLLSWEMNKGQSHFRRWRGKLHGLYKIKNIFIQTGVQDLKARDTLKWKYLNKLYSSKQSSTAAQVNFESSSEGQEEAAVKFSLLTQLLWFKATQTSLAF